MYPTSFPGLGHGRRAVSGAGSVTAADVGLILDCAFTGALTFAAAATLGNQFQVAFYVSSGTVTLTGNGAETIQSPTGSANTFVLTAGQGAYVSCDGTGLKVVLGVGLAPAPATTVVTDTIRAATTSGLILQNSSGTQVMSVGLSGTGVIFAGAVTANGGTVQIGTADINGGTLDGVTIGGSSAAAATVTDLTASTVTAGYAQVVSSGAPQLVLNTTTGGAANPGVTLSSGGTPYWEFGFQGGSGAKGFYIYDAIGGSNALEIVSNNGAISLSRAVTCSSTLTTADTNLGRTTAGYTNGSGANTGTLTNSPVTGNPTKWIPIDDNGTTRYVPAW